MAKKLIGFFNSRDSAEMTEEQLLEAGFSRSEIGIFSGQDGPGLWQEIKDLFGFADEEERQLYQEATRRGQVAVWVDLADEDATRQQQAISILQRSNPVDLDAEAKRWRAQGWTGQTAAASAKGAKSTNAQQGKSVLPVVEEELQVGKREVQTGGLRVHSYVTERPVEEQVQLREERINVERRPVNRPVSDADRPFEERSVEVTARSEQAVVNKQAKVVEEGVVNKDVSQRTETVRDKVRRTDVAVEKTASAPGQSAVVDSFAEELATSPRCRGRDWRAIESDARQNFEKKYPGRPWDQVKDAIHRTYDRVRQNA